MSPHLNPYLSRITAVRERLDSWEVEGLLIVSPTNRRWLSGFTGSNAQLLITKKKALLATDFRYYARVASEAPAFTLFEHQRQDEDTKAFLVETAVSKIGVEANHMTLVELQTLQKVSDKAWILLEETVEPLRQYKTAAEIALNRQAAAITDIAMAQFNNIAQPGKSEKQLAWELEKIMRENGADRLAFPIIVASGPNSAHPHHENSERELQEGDTIIVDMGAEVAGYKSDMTRSFYLGNTPSDKFWKIYNIVHQAQQTVFSNFKPGMCSKDVDSLARDFIAEAGYGGNFKHGLGHSVGLDIHEDPFLAQQEEPEVILDTGMNITIEPGIYLPGWGGIRIEDFAVVGDEGLEPISHCAKNPIIEIGN